jgi:hypothetical protein
MKKAYDIYMVSLKNAWDIEILEGEIKEKRAKGYLKKY